MAYLVHKKIFSYEKISTNFEKIHVSHFLVDAEFIPTKNEFLKFKEYDFREKTYNMNSYITPIYIFVL